jgi:hypothetical protein
VVRVPAWNRNAIKEVPHYAITRGRGRPARPTMFESSGARRARGPRPSGCPHREALTPPPSAPQAAWPLRASSGPSPPPA